MATRKSPWSLFAHPPKGELDSQLLLRPDSGSDMSQVKIHIIDTEEPLPAKDSKLGEEGSDAGSLCARAKSFLFKVYIIASMVWMCAAYILIIRYTRSRTPTDQLYASSTVVLFSESLKALISLLFMFGECRFSFGKCRNILRKELFEKPRELAKMSVPSIGYVVQNNLTFVALSNLDASVFQITAQLKIVATAFFMMLLLKRRFSAQHWVAILLLCTGVATVQLDYFRGPAKPQSTNGNLVVGLISMLCICLTGSFAGVYVEKMLKDGSGTSLWIRSLQMYTVGSLLSLAGCAVSDWRLITERGFLHGYTYLAVTIIVLMAASGIYVSLIMKHLDNLYRSFASAFTILFVMSASALLFNEVHLDYPFVIATVMVCGSLVLYNSVRQ